MMDDRSFDPGSCGARLDYCQIESHATCDEHTCEVRGVLSELSAGKIEVTVLSIKAGIVISVFAAILLVPCWCWQSIHGKPFNVDWWLIAIVLAPFTGSLILKLHDVFPIGYTKRH